MKILKMQQESEEWHLSINVSKTGLKTVLVDNGKKHATLSLGVLLI